MRLLIVLLLSGCSAQLAIVDDRAEQAATAQGKVSTAAYCRGNSTGWLLRKGEKEIAEFIKHCKGKVN